MNSYDVKELKYLISALLREGSDNLVLLSYGKSVPFGSKEHIDDLEQDIISLRHRRDLMMPRANNKRRTDLSRAIRTLQDQLKAARRHGIKMGLIKEHLLSEGGAGGHMRHPFDLSWVNSGRHLLSFFEKAANYIQKNETSVKIDGVNVSFKLVGGPKSKRFAIDRGSLKPIDIEGVTIDRLKERFPPKINSVTGQSVEHGMIKASTELLTILNEALPKIRKELKALGMYDDPTKFLNTEYVRGKTNVTDYGENFLAIHGVNQFYSSQPARGSGESRPGAVRPLGNKDPSKEVKYDSKAMNSLIKKLNVVSQNYGFKVYGSVPASLKNGVKKIDFSSTLNEPITVVFDEENSQTKSLGQWLRTAQNPKSARITTKDGKSIGALSKLVYLNILDQVPLSSFISSSADYQKAIDGAIIYHATRMLGNDILDALDSPMGSVRSHEGIVLRDSSFGPEPVKITGEFIVSGLQSSFKESLLQKGRKMQENILKSFIRSLVLEDIVYVSPGYGKLEIDADETASKSSGIVTDLEKKIQEAQESGDKKQLMLLRLLNEELHESISTNDPGAWERIGEHMLSSLGFIQQTDVEGGQKVATFYDVVDTKSDSYYSVKTSFKGFANSGTVSFGSSSLKWSQIEWITQGDNANKKWGGIACFKTRNNEIKWQITPTRKGSEIELDPDQTKEDIEKTSTLKFKNPNVSIKLIRDRKGLSRLEAQAVVKLFGRFQDLWTIKLAPREEISDENTKSLRDKLKRYISVADATMLSAIIQTLNDAGFHF